MADDTDQPPFIVGIVLYQGFDLLDAAGMNEVFSFVDASLVGRKITVITVARECEVKALAPVTVTPTNTFDDCPTLDLVFVPGAGDSLVDAIGDDDLHQRLREKAAEAQYVTSVCTGGLVLAAAGLLDGYEATCHWSVIDCLKLFPEVKVADGYPRYLRDRNRFTGGGISSSIDESLFMVQQIVTDLTGDPAKGDAASQRVQLSIQYNPNPPFKGGDPATAPPAVLDPVEASMKFFRDPVCAAVRKHLGKHGKHPRRS